MSNYPANFRYTKEHEWVLVEGDKGAVGITDHAQSELGDIVYVDLPQVGSTMTQGETFGSVESVKAVSDLYAPVSGDVMAREGETQPPGRGSAAVERRRLSKLYRGLIRLAIPAEIRQRTT